MCRAIYIFSALALLLGLATSADATCGTRGGPGYRAPNGRCVSWVQIGRTCGYPPTMRCKAEATAHGAPYAAKLGSKIEALRSSYWPPVSGANDNTQAMAGPSWAAVFTLLGVTAFFAFGLGALEQRRAVAKAQKLEAQRFREQAKIERREVWRKRKEVVIAKFTPWRLRQ
jgi:hypothetical protein